MLPNMVNPTSDGDDPATCVCFTHSNRCPDLAWELRPPRYEAENAVFTCSHQAPDVFGPIRPQADNAQEESGRWTAVQLTLAGCRRDVTRHVTAANRRQVPT